MVGLVSIDKTRISFDHGCDVTVAGAGEQIAFPMTRNCAIFHFCRSFPDGDSIDDLSVGLSASPSVHGATDQPLGPQMLRQLFLQHSSSLDEQAAIDRLVGHAHALVVGVLFLQPSRICSGDQFRISLRATIVRTFLWMASAHGLGRKANLQA